MVFDISIGTSQNWDAKTATLEALKTALKGTDPPKFALVFATIHYLKNKGLQQILDTVYQNVPKSTPLIGGTVAGFMNKSGVFTRGLTVLFAYSDEIDVKANIGYNTKRSPTIAAKDCSKGLLSTTGKKNNFIFLVSSAVVPNVPIFNKKVVQLSAISPFVKIFDTFSSLLQIGPSRDETVFNEFSNEMKDSVGIGGGVCDNLELFNNYVFYNNKVITNSVVALAISSNTQYTVRTSSRLFPTQKKLNISKLSKSRYVIEKINGNPPLDEYLKIMGWPKDFIDERMYRKIFYYPIINEANKNKESRMFGLVYGNQFICPMKIYPGESQLYTSSGKDLIDSITDVTGDEKSKFTFIVSCGTRLETLGHKAYLINQKILEKHDGNFLVIYTAGEYSKDTTNIKTNYQTDNSLSFY